MKPLEPVSTGPAIHPLLDLMSDAVLVLDRDARLSFANAAALRLLACEPGWPLERLQPMLGAAALRWVRGAIAEPAAMPDSVGLTLPDARPASLALRRLDAGHWVLRLLCHAAVAPARFTSVQSAPETIPASDELLRFVWASPLPAMLQGEDFLLLDVNPAFEAFSGFAREQLIGRDPVELRP